MLEFFKIAVPQKLLYAEIIYFWKDLLKNLFAWLTGRQHFPDPRGEISVTRHSTKEKHSCWTAP